MMFTLYNFVARTEMSNGLFILMAVLPSLLCEERNIFLVDMKEDPINKVHKIINNNEDSMIEISRDCKLEIFRQKLLGWNEKLKEDPLYFENPFNNFLYVKLLRIDLKLKGAKELDQNVIGQCISIVKRVISNYILPYITSESDSFIQTLPTMEDVTKSANLVGDLMETFNISLVEVTDGTQNDRLIDLSSSGLISLAIFTSSDCIVMGKELIGKKRIDLANQWAVMAQQKMLLEHCLQNEDDELEKLNNEIKEVYEDEAIVPKYYELCKSKTTQCDMNAFRNASLFCRTYPAEDIFQSSIKMEILSSEPKVDIYHQFLSLYQVERFINISRGYTMEQAGETNLDTGTTEYGFSRVADNAFLNDDEEPFAVEIKRKIGQATGLSVVNAEQLEIIRYRPGGVFPPHTDYYESEALVQSEFGNRIVIAMIFLSSVELGGNFVMPTQNISVVPNVGDMVVFYNIDNNGNNDLRTVHAGCKLFIGNKILAVFGMHHVDQDHLQCQLINK